MGDCPTSLFHLFLDENAVGKEGVIALGLSKWEVMAKCSLRDCSIARLSHAAVTCLAQVHFPRSAFLHFTGNRFEAGAIACLSGAQWPTLGHLTLGYHDLDEHDCDLLGSAHKKKRVISHIERRGYLPSKKHIIVLPSVRNVYFENGRCCGRKITIKHSCTM